MRSAFALLILFVHHLSAQSSVLRGAISDESGAVIPRATVVIVSPGGVSRTAAADNRGAYAFAGLAPGVYQVSASAPRLATVQPVRVSLGGTPVTVNLVLKIVSTAQKVTVKDDAAPSLSVDASNNASGLVLRGDDLLALSDDPDDLLADLQALAGPSAGPSGGSIFIDGFSGGELPPKDSIREIRINQNPFAPEYDKLGYGKIEIFTKPGTDRYHATLDYNLGTDWWNARNPYSAVKAPLLLNEFENSGGGPLGKRASFTLDFQRNMVNNGAITNGVMLNPATLVETPFSSIYTVHQRFWRVTPRIDYAINEKNTVTMRYSATHSDIPGAGIGNLDLESRGYDYRYLNQTVQLTETAVIGSTINETRFQFFRSAAQRIANTDGPEIQVLGAFNEGGASVGRSFDTQDSYEFQNYSTVVHGTHVWKFGARLRDQTDDNISPLNFNGTFTFGGGLAPVLDANNQPVAGQFENVDSLERYRRTLLLMRLGYTPVAIRALGGGATQFSINTGMPALFVDQFDAGLFVGDDWRVRPNVTLSVGLRYEIQTNIHDWRDWAPRVAVAWAPAAKGAKPQTVLRAGFGMFYDRFALANTLTAERYNGIIQQQQVVSDPDFFGTAGPVMVGPASTTPVVQEVSSNLRAPYILQSAVTLERQLPARTTLAVTYSNSHGLHELRSADINAPLPGTYSLAVPGSGLFPMGTPGQVFLMESSGLYNQNQLITNVNAKINSEFSLFGFYVWNKAISNTDGIGTFSANPYSMAGEYGPAATDIRNRVTLGGSIVTRWNIRFSPYFVIQSGAPFDITSGNDPYGTTLFTARPGIPSNPSSPGLIETPYGLLDPNPVPGETILPRNFGRGPGQIAMNLRVGKTFGFGGERGGSKSSDTPAPPAGNPATAATGRGLGGLIGAQPGTRRYNLIVSMSIRNLLNHTNPGPINGDITSPLFGQANQMAGNTNGEGFSENANNRRLELQIRFTF
jgi:carboxypeptidase family protein